MQKKANMTSLFSWGIFTVRDAFYVIYLRLVLKFAIYLYVIDK